MDIATSRGSLRSWVTSLGISVVACGQPDEGQQCPLYAIADALRAKRPTEEAHDMWMIELGQDHHLVTQLCDDRRAA
eukprot:scaffold650_cov407-Prasinococcus_capsulatus_cf.AAC.14